MKLLPLIFVTLFFLIVGCKKEEVTTCETNSTTEPVLLFKSGFENGVYIDPTAYVDNEDYRFIRGLDLQTGFSWPISVLGASNSALHYIEDDNHQAVNAQIMKTIGHNGDSTMVLFQKENYAFHEDTQCPYEILDIADGSSDLYIKFWIKLDSLSLTQVDKWRTFFEYKTKDYASGDGFRLISYIYTDLSGNPYWHFQGDRDPVNYLWEIDNTSVPVPMNEWFETEFYWHWSEGDDGYVMWKVNGQLIGEHSGPTTRNSKSLDFIILSQIYGDANPKYQYVDDIEIWNKVP